MVIYDLMTPQVKGGVLNLDLKGGPLSQMALSDSPHNQSPPTQT